MYYVLPEAGCIGECCSNDTETVSIEHDPNELDDKCKHHLPRVVGTNVSIANRGECG